MDHFLVTQQQIFVYQRSATDLIHKVRTVYHVAWPLGIYALHHTKSWPYSVTETESLYSCSQVIQRWWLSASGSRLELVAAPFTLSGGHFLLQTVNSRQSHVSKMVPIGIPTRIEAL